MLFNSTAFLLFFPIAVGLYFATPHRARWVVLLAASYLFYGWWRVEYLSLIVASTVVDYVAALRMGRHATRRGRGKWLVLSLATNLGLLATFKYLGFFAETANALAGFIGADGRLHVPALLLPVGISFYTFQTLAYSIDVYRGRQAPERHLGIFALYVSFWPQLVAGPIERSGRLLPQFRVRQRLEPERVTSGLLRMAWGFFKKVVIADRLAIYVEAVYSDPEWGGAAAIGVATYLFAIQIYCDFSGYTDIAIGAARVMGFELMENFRQPYLARSIREFWGRWHISLSTWFRDYLYIPLGGNRVSRPRWVLNLMVVFVVSGLWHGAAWTFVVWGALHGLYLVVGDASARVRDRAWAAIGERIGRGRAEPFRDAVAVGVCFHLVLVGWLFFRAESIGDAGHLLARMGEAWSWSGLGGKLTPYERLLAAGSIVVLVAVEWAERRPAVLARMRALPPVVRYASVAAFVLSIVMFGEFGATTFIYFQF